jgi:hypothetical protein
MSKRRRSKLARKYRKNPDFTKSKKRGAMKGRAAHRYQGASRTQGRRGRGRHGHKIIPMYPARHNPFDVDWVETGKLVGIGFGGFAAGRLVTRIVAVQVAKKKPTWAKHAGVLANAAAFAAALFLARKWSKSRPYELPLVMGTGLSFAQTFLQTYFPKLGWMVADASADDIAQASGQLITPQSQGLLPPDDGDDEEDADWSSYNDAYDHGRHARDAQPRHQQPHQQTATAPAAPAPAHDEVDDMLAELDDNGDVFAN